MKVSTIVECLLSLCRCTLSQPSWVDGRWRGSRFVVEGELGFSLWAAATHNERTNHLLAWHIGTTYITREHSMAFLTNLLPVPLYRRTS